ncbi:short-chain dehydrogenase [Opitutaceae bacterium EW11]|nr:short-chain dehydrogenase [Opitutaceae bacterium EW11]
MNTETVLITGASSGIGREIARQFAKHSHPLVLVAPVQAELQSVATDLSSLHQVPVHVIAKDLSQDTAAEEIVDELRRDDVTVDILVNNAGLGQRGQFWDIPTERYIEIMRVNMEAVVRLTRLFLPPMLRRGHGRVMNTASIAGFEPGPLLAVYHATKAFVLSLSEALATELKDTGITVTALCPGPVDTDFFPKAEMIDTKVFQKGNVMAPQEVAEVAFDACMRGERVVVPGGMNKAMVFSRRLMPESAQAKMNETYYEEVKSEDRKRERGDIEAEARRKE